MAHHCIFIHILKLATTVIHMDVELLLVLKNIDTYIMSVSVRVLHFPHTCLDPGLPLYLFEHVCI